MRAGKLRYTGLVAGAAAAAFVAMPSGASAAFDAPHYAGTCRGISGAGEVNGVGSSSQGRAHWAWGAELSNAYGHGISMRIPSGFGYLDRFSASENPEGHGCANAALVGGSSVNYRLAGSEAGRRAVGASTEAGLAGVRDLSVGFAGVDEAPTAAEIAAANEGPTGASGDDATLHTIPVAQFAVAVVVKLPVDCYVDADPGQRHISRTALAAAFAGTATTWSAVLPSATLRGSGCSTPVRRVVRSDSSGATWALKGYLRSIDGASFPVHLPNTAWPNDVSQPVVRGTVSGGDSQLNVLNARVDGGIAYADLATARDKGFDWEDDLEVADNDRTFWLRVQRSSGAHSSPAVSDDLSASGDLRGSNCLGTTYANAAPFGLPATTGSWHEVTANEPSGGYSICALTYALAWERPSTLNFGVPWQRAIPQSRARFVRDYLGFAVEERTGLNGTLRAGQSQLAAAGYQRLPEGVRTISRVGVGALNW